MAQKKIIIIGSSSGLGRELARIYAQQKNGQGIRHYAVKAGDTIEDEWDFSLFGGGQYHLRIHGPNGFYREAKGAGAAAMNCKLRYEGLSSGAASGNILLVLEEIKKDVVLLIRDNAYGARLREVVVKKGQPKQLSLSTADSGGWYDLSVSIKGNSVFHMRFCGHVENGQLSHTDPAMA